MSAFHSTTEQADISGPVAKTADRSTCEANACDPLDAPRTFERSEHVTVIEPAKPWQVINVRELWQHRELLVSLAWRDIKVRYKQTVLGAAWAVLQPAAMMIVFTVFFGRMARVPHGDLPYPIFVFAGLLPWMFFSTSLTASANSVLGSERLISKIYFPRLAIPFAAIGAPMVDMLIALSGLALMMLYYGVMPTASILFVPFFLGLIGLAALGFGILLAALTVRYRDFKHVTPFLVQLWLFATPSVYMSTAASKGRTYPAPETVMDHLAYALHYMLAANPLTPLIASFRAAVLGDPIPYGPLAIAAVGTFLVFLAGCFYFRSVEDSFADII